MPAKNTTRLKKEDANQAAIRELYGPDEGAVGRAVVSRKKKSTDLRSEFSEGEQSDPGKLRLEEGK